MKQEHTTSSSSRSTKRTFYLENLGCAKNQVDAEVMISVLEEDGWIYSENPDIANVILINSCGFIKSAKEENISVILGSLNDYPDKDVVVCGCLSQRYGEELKKEIPQLKAVWGNDRPELIAEFLEKNLDYEKPEAETGKDMSLPIRTHLLTYPGSAYLKLAEGCDNRCSYCAIPLIRGDVRSRSVSEVISEFKTMVSRGIKEVNLVAQDLAHFGKDRGSEDLPVLLKEMCKIDGDFRVRLLYIHPDHFPMEIVDIMVEDSRIIPYFDIPFQHADSEVLRSMGRKGNIDIYLELIGAIRSKLGDKAVFRTTFMTGFHNESEEAFNTLLEFQSKAKFDWLGVFCYSPEEDTPAFRDSKKNINRQIRKKAEERKFLLEEQQIKITNERLNRFVGKEFNVIIEELVDGEDLSLGRSYIQAPEVDGLVVVLDDETKPGEIARCSIRAINGPDMEAVVIE